MTNEPRILVISACSAQKDTDCPQPLGWNDFRDRERLLRRKGELEPWAKPAELLYSGREHTYVRSGVHALRGTHFVKTDWRIASAGFSLVASADRLVPYDVSLRDLGGKRAYEWAHQIGLPPATRRAARDYPMVVFLLGERYLKGIGYPLLPSDGQRFIYLTTQSAAKQLNYPGVTAVPLGRSDWPRYGAPKTAIKGRVFAYFAGEFARDPGSLWPELIASDSPGVFLRIAERGAGRGLTHSA